MIFQSLKKTLVCSSALLLTLGLSTHTLAVTMNLGGNEFMPYAPILQDNELNESEVQDLDQSTFRCLQLEESLELEKSLEGEPESDEPLEEVSRVDLSTVGAQLIAQASIADIAPPVSEPLNLNPTDPSLVLSESSSFPCGLLGEAVGGGIPSGPVGFNPVLASPLALLGTIPALGNGNTSGNTPIPNLAITQVPTRQNSQLQPGPIQTSTATKTLNRPNPKDVESVPEPITILGTGLALGLGTVMERRRRKLLDQ